MFERFSDDAKSALNRARQHAQRLLHDYFGTEHLLLGLLDTEGSTALSLLDSLGIDRLGLRSAIEKEVAAGNARPGMGALPFTPGVKKALERGMREAQADASRYIGSEHLLLGLTGEPEDVASRVLEAHGLTIERVRAFVRSHADAVRPSSSGDHRSEAWRLRVLEDAVDALVELQETSLAAGVQEVARRHGSRK